MLASMSMHRVAAVVVALVVPGCASSVTGSPEAATPKTSPAPSTTSAAGLDCLVDAPGHSGIDRAFDDLDGYTVTPVCPADAIWVKPEVTAEFGELNAAEISENGTPSLRVVVGQVNSGSGEEFVDKYLHTMSATGWEHFDPPKTLSTGPPEEIGGYSVTHFHMFVAAEGYAYADGTTVVIAHFVGVAEPAQWEEDFVTILNSVYLP
jgi:hypothetical protein